MQNTVLLPAAQGQAQLNAPTTITVELSGDGPSLCSVARRLIAQGSDPATRLEAFRGDTLALAGPIGAFACLRVADDRHGVPRFRKFDAGGVGRLDQEAKKRSAPMSGKGDAEGSVR